MKYQNIELHNVCSLVEDDKPGVGLCRSPLACLPNINQGARNMSMLTASCEIRGMLPPGGRAEITLQSPNDNSRSILASFVCNSHSCTPVVLSRSKAI